MSTPKSSPLTRNDLRVSISAPYPVAPRPGLRIIPGMAHLLTRRVAAWFTLTREERWLAAGVLALLLLGLGARAWHLHAKTSQPYVPPEVVHE